MNALVIDDSSTTRRIIQGILLSSCGFTEVVQKENGKTGLEEILNNHGRYHIIILDWYMPEMDGIDVLLAIRNAHISTPVIICTSAEDKESIINAITAGANEYLIKPFEAGVFQSKVEKVLVRFQARLMQKKTVRILVVDDSEIVREAIKLALMKDGVITEVVLAEDGNVALKLFSKRPFNLVLLDWQMPELDGMAVLREIRKNDTHTPVIMATGNSKIDQMVEAFDAGASNFIPKPFIPADMLKKVYQLIVPADPQKESAKNIELP